ncbi:MAG: hypothetical protein ACTH0S_05620 [Senegalia sp. (in: firmicutes)]
MNDFKGSFSIVFRELKLQFYIFTIVLILLAAVYVAIGYFGNPEDFRPLLSGPAYGILGFLPLFLFYDPFKASIELGATRKQYIFSVWSSYLMFVVALLIVHEVISYIVKLTTDFSKSTVVLLRVGDLIPNASVLDNFWIDFLAILFIAGVCFLLAAIMYRVGIIPTVLGVFTIGVIVFIWSVLGDIMPLIEWIMNHIYETFHILGAVGVIAALLIYPIMIRARMKE